MRLQEGGGLLHARLELDPVGHAVGEQLGIGRVGRVAVEFLFQQALGLELGVGVGETHAHRTDIADGLKDDALRRQAGFLQRAFDQAGHTVVNLDSRLGAADLQGRRFAEEVGQGVDHAEQQRDDDDDVFPDWVAIHGMELR